MDPMTIAASAVQLLLPVFRRLHGRMTSTIEQDLGTVLDEQIDQLYELIKQRIAGESLAETAFSSVQERPENERDQGALQLALAHLLTEDSEFRAAVQELLSESRPSGPAIQSISDSGALSIGGELHIDGVNAAGRDIHTGDQQIEGKP